MTESRTNIHADRLLSCFCSGPAEERVAMIGNEIKASLSGVDRAGTTVLMRDAVLEDGVVFAYSAFFRSEKPVRFQIMRPVENETDTYQLIGETRVIPAVKNAREDVSIA